jgi:hypothetical protein
MDCFATPHVASEKIDGNECEVETKAPALRWKVNRLISKLTLPMIHSPCWEVDSRSAGQEIPSLLRKRSQETSPWINSLHIARLHCVSLLSILILCCHPRFRFRK